MVKTANKRTSVFGKFKGRCAYCGCNIKIDDFHIDHIISQRGVKSGRLALPESLRLNDLENLYPSCSSCNSMKYDFSIEEFREFIRNGLSRLQFKDAKLKLAAKLGLVEFKDRSIVFYFETFKDKYNG